MLIRCLHFFIDAWHLLIDLLNSLFKDFLHLHYIFKQLFEFFLTSITFINVLVLFLQTLKGRLIGFSMNIDGLFIKLVFFSKSRTFDYSNRLFWHSSSISVKFRLFESNLRWDGNRGYFKGLKSSIIQTIRSSFEFSLRHLSFNLIESFEVWNWWSCWFSRLLQYWDWFFLWEDLKVIYRCCECFSLSTVIKHHFLLAWL